MTHVVTAPCEGCKTTKCVGVCPVDCFYEDTNMLVINPKECIDCGACIAECPQQAIFQEDSLPTKYLHYIQINAQKSQSGLPNIRRPKPKEEGKES